MAQQQSSVLTQSVRRKRSRPTRRPADSAVAAPIRTVVSDADVLRFVERTTAASNVPLLLEDRAAIEQVARVLA